MKKKLVFLSAVIAVCAASMLITGCSAERYYIFYEPNGGVLAAESREVKYDSRFVLDIPQRDDATFLGWFQSLARGSERVADEWGESLDKYMLRQNSTVFAQWDYWDTPGLIYTLLSDGNGYSVSSPDGLSVSTLKIPEEHNGKPVRRIASFGFADNKSLMKVVMPPSVMSIGISAFEDCSNIETIEVSENLEAIEQRAFFNCSQLLEFSFGPQLAFIGQEAFSRCRMLGIVDFSEVKNGIEFRDRVFAGCTALYEVTLPEKLKEIPQSAFSGCSSLKEIEIVGDIEKINNNSFDGCTQLRRFHIGKNVRMIGLRSFNGCDYLDEITVDLENLYFSAEGNVLFSKDKTALLRYAPYQTALSYTIPSSVAEIDSGAFNRSYWLETVTVGKNVLRIRQGAFSDMLELNRITLPFIGGSYESNNYFSFIFGGEFASLSTNIPHTLRNVTILDGIEIISEHAFQFCNSITEINIPNSVRTISRYAFYGCANLAELTLPSNLSEIGEYAFLVCTRLNAVTISPQNENFLTLNGVLYKTIRWKEGDVEYANRFGELLLYPAGKSDLTYTVWPNTERIADSAFYFASQLREVILNEGLKEIGAGAFAFCRNLTTIILPASLTKIGEQSFTDCIRLTEVNISANLEEIGRQAFFNCRELKAVNIQRENPPALGGLVFLNTHAELEFIFTSGSVKADYENDAAWAEYRTRFVVI